MQTLTVPPSSHGERLDRFLRDSLDLGRKEAMDLIAAGSVELTRGERRLRRLKKSDLVEEGDRIEVHWTGPSRAEPDPEVAPAILFESELAIVCEKPAGLPSGAVRGQPRGNLAAGLLALYPEMAEVGHGPMEPGLVHRLDTWTSGLLAAARTREGFSLLTGSLQSGALEKKYLAIVSLRKQSGVELGSVLEIESDLEPDPDKARRVRLKDGSRYRTQATLLAESGERALLEVRAGRAYRHQIRAHLAALGFPLVGDELYGSSDLESSPRHALHAYYLASAEVPVFRVRSALPDDLRALMGPTFDTSSLGLF